MFDREHPCSGLNQGRARIALALGLVSVVALAPVRLAAAAPRAQASGACSGTITVQLAGVRQTASRIETRNVSCAAGKGVLRSFLQRANRQPACRSAALFQPPTPGCEVSGYHCFLRKTVNYCASVARREVSWRLRIASTRCPIGRGQRPFFREITGRGVLCATARAAVQAFLRSFPEPASRFRAAGRQWTWSRTLLRGYPRVSGTTERMRSRLRSGRAEVLFLSLPFS
jgi:hypothetical protein